MHKLEIISDISKVSEVESLIEKVCEEYHLSDDYYGNILIAVTEAVNNSIIHGNKNNLTKKVVVTVNKETKEIVFSVYDEGDGFDYNNLPDPTAPENIEKPDGRGIFLMKNLSDKVEFFNKGTQVNITFIINE